MPRPLSETVSSSWSASGSYPVVTRIPSPVVVDGLDAVDGQIQDDLFDVLRIAFHQGDIIGQLNVQGHAGFSDGCSGQAQGIFYGLVDLDRDRVFDVGLLGEIFQVGYDLGDPIRGQFRVREDLGQVFVQVGVGQAAEGFVRVFGGDTGEQRQKVVPHPFEHRHAVHEQVEGIVDLVGHPGHQLAQGLHFLCLVEQFLADPSLPFPPF